MVSLEKFIKLTLGHLPKEVKEVTFDVGIVTNSLGGVGVDNSSKNRMKFEVKRK